MPHWLLDISTAIKIFFLYKQLIFGTFAQAIRRVQEYLLLSLISLKDPVTRVRVNVFFLINILYYVANRLPILNQAHYSGEKSLHFTEMMKGPCQAIMFRRCAHVHWKAD